MTMYELRFDPDRLPHAPTPRDLILRVGEFFPDASISLEEALAAEVRRVQAWAEARGEAEEERVRSVVRSLQNKAERMGPVYRFNMIMDGNVKVHGYVRPGDIAFFYHGEHSDKFEQMIMNFLSSLNLGSIEKT